MADPAVTVSFTGDATQLNAVLKQVQDGLRNTQNEGGKTERANEGVMTSGIAMATRLAASLAALAAAYLGVRTAANLFRSAIAEAAEIESIEANIQVLLRGDADATKKLMADLQAMTISTPFSMEQLASAAQQMLNTRIPVEEITGHLQMLGEIAGTDADRMRVLTKSFSDMVSMGKLTSTELLQMINAGFNPLTVVMDKTGETMAEVRTRFDEGRLSVAEVLAAMKEATQVGGLYFGNLASQAKTWNGMITALRGQWSMFLQEFGKPIMESLKPALQYLLDQMEGVVELGRKWGTAIGDTIKVLMTTFQSGQMGDLFILTLKLGLYESVNVFAKGLLATIELAVSTLTIGMTELFGNAGWIQTLTGLASIFGGAIMAAISAPVSGIISETQSWLGLAVANIQRIAKGEEPMTPEEAKAFRGGAKRVAKEEFLNTHGIGGEALELSKAMVEAGMQTITDSLTSTAIPRMRGAGQDFVDTYRNTPDAIDTSDLRGELRGRWEAAKAQTDAAASETAEEEAKPASTVAGGLAEVAKVITGISTIAADSLAAIGGGGGVAWSGMSPEQQQLEATTKQTSLIEAQSSTQESLLDEARMHKSILEQIAKNTSEYTSSGDGVTFYLTHN